MISQIRSDLQAVFERDPAVNNILEVLLSYSGLHAVIAHRFIHKLYSWGLRTVPRFLSQIVRFLTGGEIHPGAEIGQGFFIDHGMGVVIGETAEIGDDVTLYQGVTLGGTGKEKGKRHPTIRDGVLVGCGAIVLGAIEIGENAKIGAGSVVLDSVPENSTVVGVPGRVIVHNGERVDVDCELDHCNLPDPLGDNMLDMQKRINELEKKVSELEERTQKYLSS